MTEMWKLQFEKYELSVFTDRFHQNNQSKEL